ncbi:CPBP family intramembrane glutamic endopeptidase [Paenibacillus selenitireducens]
MDGLISLAFYVYYIVFLYLYGLLIFQTSIMKEMSKFFSNPYVFVFSVHLFVSIISVLPIFFVLHIRKQTLVSIGFRFKKVLFSICLGIIGAIILTWSEFLAYFTDFESYPLHGNDLVFRLFDTFICIALVEEIAFRGYIQTRILGLIRNKYVAIFVVGIMFSLMHIPFQMLQADMSLIDHIMVYYPNLIFHVIMHIVFVYLYTRNYELIAPTITHALRNLLLI